MAAGQQYRALYEFTSTGAGVFSLKPGEQFTLVSKTNNDWWTVRSTSGEKGLAPINYLEACPVRNGGPVKSAAYVAMYDYTAQATEQLSFSKGQPLTLVDKTDLSWWSMRKADGTQGLVPVNYIDKLDTAGGPPTHVMNASPPGAPEVTVSVNNLPTSNSYFSSSPPHTPTDEGFQQVLASIDSNIARIHTEAANQGGTYSAAQKSTLQKLVLHRQSFVSANKPPILDPNSTHPFDSSSPTSTSPSKSSPPKGSHYSPIPKRHAPPPPTTSPTKVANGSNVPTRRGSSQSPQRRGSSDEANRKQKKAENRYSLQPSMGEYDDNLASRRAAPPPPTRQPEASLRGQQQQQQASEMKFYSLQRPASSGKTRTSSSNLSPPKSHPFSSDSSSSVVAGGVSRRASDTAGLQYMQHQQQQQQQSLGSPEKGIRSHSQDLPRQRSGSGEGVPLDGVQQQLQHQQQQLQQLHHQQQQLQQQWKSQQSPSSPHSPSRGSSEQQQGVENTPTRAIASPPALTPPTLPTTFSQQDGAELVESVRNMAAITHRKAQQAVGAVLMFLKKKVPQSEGMVDGMFAALEHAMQENSASTVSEQHSDLERLKEIFFEVTECKDDSQQRGWAVHDDEKAISDLLEELLQILCDANPEVSKAAVMEDNYENVLTLITYYQMEPRVPIRLLLLKVFGVLCGLDRTTIGIFLASVLPNELGRDIQQNMSELQKALYSSTVCTMIFSTAEAVPLSVYDQWDTNYVIFLLDTIESPPEEDEEDQLPDAFLNMVLAFNQHFPDPASNLVMKALKQRPNPRNFSEKLMFLINRGEDPVAITKPCCPDSITKFLLDLFSEKSTAGMFYTTDMRVLIDIVVRQLTDLCPGMETRTHYLELLFRIVGSTDYRDHLHRHRDLVACLNRVGNEEEAESHDDRELVKKIWMTYPQVFEEITDL